MKLFRLESYFVKVKTFRSQDIMRLLQNWNWHKCNRKSLYKAINRGSVDTLGCKSTVNAHCFVRKLTICESCSVTLNSTHIAYPFSLIGRGRNQGWFPQLGLPIWMYLLFNWHCLHPSGVVQHPRSICSLYNPDTHIYILVVWNKCAKSQN